MKSIKQITEGENLALKQTDSIQIKVKILEKPSNTIPPVDYERAILWLENKAKVLYGKHFFICESDKGNLVKLIAYFLRDESICNKHNINLEKGIMLTGPVGCGKTTLMQLMRFFGPIERRHILKSCRDISFEFSANGFDVIAQYSKHSFNRHEPKIYCFDDLGVENNIKHFGNECNVMAEIILSRYEYFISNKMITHLTTNLSATEIENFYGNRVRSRMREMFNLIAFDKSTNDKRI